MSCIGHCVQYWPCPFQRNSILFERKLEISSGFSCMNDLIPVLVHCLRHEAVGIVGIDLKPLSPGSLPRFTPGAHIDLHLPGGLIRSYSLVSPPNRLDHYSICVQIASEGRGGSRYLHDGLKIGSTLNISRPRNKFSLHASLAPAVLIAGGIGITPIFSMFNHLCAAGRPVELLYFARSRDSAAFADRLEGSRRARLSYSDKNDNRPSLEQYLSKFDSNAHFYCCGPHPMLEDFKSACTHLGLPNWHVEEFGSAQRRRPIPHGGYQVELHRSGLVLRVAPNQSLLDAVLNAGVQWDYACREGVCGACQVEVLDGLPDHRDSVLTGMQRSQNRHMLICVSGSKGPRLTLNL